MKTSIKTLFLLLLILITIMISSLLFTIYMLSTLSYYNVSYSTVNHSIYYQILYMLYLFIALMLMTWVLIMLIKHNLSKVIFWIFVIVSSLIIFEFLSFLLPLIFSLIATVVIMVYYFKYANIIGRDIVNIILFISISSFISLALGFIASVILTAIIAVYDYIAVFKTKHMITLVKGMKENIYLGGIILMAKKIKGRVMIGGGDLVFPSILFTSTAIYFSMNAAYFVLAGAILGLLILIITGKKDRAYPAMTFMGPTELAMLGLYFLISSI